MQTGRTGGWAAWLRGTTLLLWLLMSGCARDAGRIASDSVNVLSAATLTQTNGVACPECLRDGLVGREGGHWKSQVAALLTGPDSSVVFDLGSVKQVRAGWLQGDNNDTYRVEISKDGHGYLPLWDAAPVGLVGLRGRERTGLDGRGRYVRLTALGGDGNFSVTELQLFSSEPQKLPAGVEIDTSIPIETQVRGNILAFGVALIGLLVLSYRRAPRLWLALVFAIPLAAGYDLVVSLVEGWPHQAREVSLVRGTLAVVAAAALLREFWAPRRFPAHRGVVLGVLGACGAMALLAFYNLGQPQFRDQQLGERTYVHHLDLRQYYATAKYFDEIGYRALYEADVAAYLEDHPERGIDSIASRPMRSLRTHEMSTVGHERAGIARAPGLFEKERWEQYKADARYFREAMGSRQYFSTFYDLGGNATPVWIAIAHLMFSQFPASNAAFELTALLDPLLVLGAFLAIGWVFGPRTAFVCMVVFGANDFIMYGSNWGGATLRHDWMAYIALGACALKRQKWRLAGALLALATSIRAFPALALVCLSFPVLWWCIDQARARQRASGRLALWRALPGPRAVLNEQRPLFEVALGALVTATTLFFLSSALLGWDAWSDWYTKVSQLSSDPHGNHISLRSLIAGWQHDQADVLADRMPLFVLAVLFYVGMVFVACRRQCFEQCAVLGLSLTPVLFYPANYYIHLVWLLPLVMVERRKLEDALARPFAARHVWVGALLLGMCAAQYFTVLETDRSVHFYMASVLLFATLAALLTVLVRAEALAKQDPVTASALALAAETSRTGGAGTGRHAAE